MTRLRKFFTREMLTKQMNQVLRNEDEENVSSSLLRNVSLSSEATESIQIRKRKKETEQIASKKKPNLDSEWRTEDSAQSIGKLLKITGVGRNKKFHYEKFEFHGIQHKLGDTVELVPENEERERRRSYVATIKDIYVHGKEGYVKLFVQWFYRPEDVEKKTLGKWEPKDTGEIFYSFHYDEVPAESVKYGCDVFFVPENKQVPSQWYCDFSVQYVYNFVNKKLRKFTHNDFNKEQRHELSLLVAKTNARVGGFIDIEKDQETFIYRRKKLVPSSERSNAAEPFDYKVILETFDMLTGYSIRDKILVQLLEAVKDECRVIKKKQAGGNFIDFVWPNDAVPMVRVLEQVAFEDLGNDMPKYHHKFAVLLEKLKDSRVLARRFLHGQLHPRQVIKMTKFELTSGFTFSEMTDTIKEETPKIDDRSSTNKKF